MSDAPQAVAENDPAAQALEELRRYAIETGAKCGVVSGDQLAEAFAKVTALDDAMPPALAEAIRVEFLADAVVKLRETEHRLVREGVHPDRASDFRTTALMAMLARLRLAGITTAASGPVN